MNIAFMGTPDFAVPCLEILIKNNYNITAVVTQPDKPVGRSGQLVFPPVKDFASKSGINVYQPEKVKNAEFIEFLKTLDLDLIVVVAFGQILPKAILDIPKLGCINVHASLLPKYRGAAPIQWSIINGDTVTGITTMYMDEGMDTGDIILKKETNINDEDTSESLFNRLSIMGSETLIETIELINKGTVPRVQQDSNLATYAPMISKEFGQIDFSKSATDIRNIIRGTYPWPGAYSFYKGKRLKIFEANIVKGNFKGDVGEIVEVLKDSITIKCGQDAIRIFEIQMEGSKRMSVKEYLSGHTVGINEILGEN